MTRPAKDFFAPLAVGAPAPPREIPARPSRAIHFFDPGNEKMAAKVPDMVGNVDVLLGRCSGRPCGPGPIPMLPRSRRACRSGPAGGGWLIVAG